MKKFLCVLFAVILTLVASYGLNADAAVGSAAGTPTVDGKPDNVYVCQPVSLDEGGIHADIFTAWDADYFYVYADAGSSGKDVKYGILTIRVELPETDGANAFGQYTLSPRTETVDGSGEHFTENSSRVKSSFLSIPDGYRMEIAIPWGVYAPKVGARFRAAFKLSTGTGMNVSDENDWFTVTLTADKYGLLSNSDNSPLTADALRAAFALFSASFTAIAVYMTASRRKITR